MDDDLPTVSPDGAAVLYLLHHLVKELEEEGALSSEAFAQRLLDHQNEMPEDARHILRSFIGSVGDAPTRQ